MSKHILTASEKDKQIPSQNQRVAPPPHCHSFPLSQALIEVRIMTSHPPNKVRVGASLPLPMRGIVRRFRKTRVLLVFHLMVLPILPLSSRSCLKVEPRPIGQLAHPLPSNSLRHLLTFRARPPTRRVVASMLTPPRMHLPNWEAEFGTHA